ncbi:uncharacterized protein LOC131885848 isoform X2 [Tigriopus californicus]|uniref:uncharacterized protein LOC131885848 isoform X2 n=1 Tax=Tigriopus californicus TaxID=6832 RepID=UPI0027DA86A1|nr:uncharacterized protein LOC131885848 isoform X2 [Tigriopus californicus]
MSSLFLTRSWRLTSPSRCWSVLPRSTVPPTTRLGPGLRFQSDQSEETDLATKSYIKNHPELQKVLADIYKKIDKTDENPRAKFSLRHEEFQDEDAEIIYDVDEERDLKKFRKIDESAKSRPNSIAKETKFRAFDLNRGEQFVFSVEEVVEALRREKCLDICVISIPKDAVMADFMVIATCKTKPQLKGAARFLRKLYKLKKAPTDIVPKTEGLQTESEWLATDFGNVVVHLFLKATREHYDLESLWALGPELDVKASQSEGLEEFLANRNVLKDFEPMPH